MTTVVPSLKPAPVHSPNGGPPPLPPQAPRARVIAALLVIYLIWGSSYLGIHYSLESFPPFLMSGVRFIVAGGLLFAFERARGAPMPERVEWRSAAIVGVFLLVLGMGGVAFAQQWVPSSLAALVVATTPLWAALFAGLFGQWPQRLEWVGLGLGFVGVILLNLEGGLRANPLGAGVLMLAPMCWAFGSMWRRRLPLPRGLMSSAIEMLVGGVGLFGVSVVLGERMTELPTLRAVAALAYLIVFGAVVGFSAYGYLLRHVRPAVATSYAYVNPTIAVVLGVGLVGEQISGRGIIGMFIILAGVALVILTRDG